MNNPSQISQPINPSNSPQQQLNKPKPIECNNLENVIKLAMYNIDKISVELPKLFEKLEALKKSNKNNGNNVQKIETQNKQTLLINIRNKNKRKNQDFYELKSELDKMYGQLEGDNEAINTCFSSLNPTNLQPNIKSAFDYYTKCSKFCFKLLDFSRKLLLLC
jgi:hypothetical protein